MKNLRTLLALMLCITLCGVTGLAAADAVSATATAPGFGGEVKVSLSVEGEKVTGVEIVGQKETPEIGGKAIEALAGAMLASGSVEVDAYAGATFTSEAVIAAAKQAYAAATGAAVEAEAAVMKPGVYTGAGKGHRSAYDIYANVTVSEREILSIEIDRSTVADTIGIFDSAYEQLVPRIIDNQSVAVDSITGATVSSAGIKQAVTDALKQALVAGGSTEAAIAAFKKAPEKSTEVVEMQTGVLVVGLGGAGMSAAVHAAQTLYAQAPEQVDVLAIEKAGRVGGMASLTMSLFALNPEKYCAEFNNGQEYADPNELRADWLSYTRGDAKTDSIDAFLKSSGEVFDWLVYDNGLRVMQPSIGLSAADTRLVCFNYADADKGLTVRRQGTISFYDQMMKKFTDMGGEYMLNTAGYELICDEAGKVVGCKARKDDGTEYVIKADSVIIATGGFGGNGEMEEKYLSNEYYPLKGEWKLEGMRQNKGEMIQAALDIGASTYNIDMPPMVHMSGSYGFLTQFERHVTEQYNGQTNMNTVWTEGDAPLFMGLQGETLAVDASGKRFAAETGLAMLEPWKAGPTFYSLWSAEMVESLKTNGFKYPTMGVAANNLGMCGPIPQGWAISNIDDVMNAAIEVGYVFKGTSLSELEAQLGMEAGALTSTVASYNALCEAGADAAFGKAADYLEPYAQDGEYYAIKMASYCYGTCGALNVNTNYQVLQADGVTPIDGLYAAGQDSMGVLFTNKDCYVTYGGVAESFAFVSGYGAGEHAANAYLSK